MLHEVKASCSTSLKVHLNKSDLDSRPGRTLILLSCHLQQVIGEAPVVLCDIPHEA